MRAEFPRVEEHVQDLGKVSVEETFWGLTTFFNPSGSSERSDNYHRFRERSLAQGMPLLTVELALENGAFQLRSGRDAEILIQRRSSSVLWHKERLLNIGLRALPPSCENVCWIDADVLFEDDDWIAESRRLLEKYVVIQPFSHCIRLPAGARPVEFPSTMLDRGIMEGSDEGTYSASVCRRMSKFRSRFAGTTGYAWCAHRVFLDAVGFYDRCVVGGGDQEMALAMLFFPGKVPLENIRSFCPELRRDLAAWHMRAHEVVRRRVGHRSGTIHHLFHGASSARGYAQRHQILVDHEFHPQKDLRLDENGCFSFAPGREALARAVADYFKSRAEGGAPLSR